jgi:hypothetical protein
VAGVRLTPTSEELSFAEFHEVIVEVLIGVKLVSEISVILAKRLLERVVISNLERIREVNRNIRSLRESIAINQDYPWSPDIDVTS